MITMEQFLENNSEQEGICIAVYGKEQYDEFMNILENNNYKWSAGNDLESEEFYESKIGEHTSFIILFYLSKNKTITYMKFLLDIKLDYEDIDFVFYDSEGYAECLIKPFPCLKREIEELGLC